MDSSVYGFLKETLGVEGASALEKATDAEPTLEPLLVPRAALAWLGLRDYYEGRVPGDDNSYLRFQKSEAGFQGVISLGGDQTLEFQTASPEFMAAAVAVSLGVPAPGSGRAKDRQLLRLGASIDALARTQELTKSLAKKVLDPGAGYQLKEEHGPAGLKVHAFAPGGQHVGTAWFSHHPEGLKPVTVTVDDDHQRRGLASAMYDHAKKISGKPILAGDVQTDEGAAFRSTYKTELPGQTARPQKQLGPTPPQGPDVQAKGVNPQKPQQPQQPGGGAKPGVKLPKIPKIPSLKVGKSDLERSCPACDGVIFKNGRFVGCLCWSELRKNITTTVYEDGSVIEFKIGSDLHLVKALIRALRYENL